MRLLVIAAILTGLNALKPVVVDDTAYLLFARHLSKNPLDPYGFQLFWYARPDSAMDILLPPVLPYWLALGIGLFGESVLALKLWLFPFALLLVWAIQQLRQRLAPHSPESSLALLALSAFVLPLFSVMLDVPALALGLACIACYWNGFESRRLLNTLLAGVLLALAMQTKYSMLSIPVVLVGLTLLQAGWWLWRGYLQLLGVAAVSALLFFGWEYWLWKQYGQSHFWLHVVNQANNADDWWAAKRNLIAPSVTFLGLLAGGWGLLAAPSLGFPRWFVRGVLLFGLLGSLLIALGPTSWGLDHPAMNGPNLVFGLLGLGLFITISLASLRLLIRWPSLRLRWNRDSVFLIGWLLWEALAYLILTPFPAGRRVMSLSFVIALLACRLVSFSRCRPDRWAIAYLGFTGFGLFALDAWDAQAERDVAQQAVELTRPAPGERSWTQGHWGWQYYADRAGLQLVIPGETTLQAGDWLIVPRDPDAFGFYRPWHGFANFQVESDRVEWVGAVAWKDGIPGQTIPNLYGGFYPITRRQHPRLRAEVYRVRIGWTADRPRE